MRGPDPNPKKSFSTQQLLSMNMDRLKGYMEKFGTDDTAKPPQRKSQRLTVFKPGREVLFLMHDPMRLVKIDGVNDKLPPGQRFRLVRCQSYTQAVEKLLESEFRLMVIDDGFEKTEEGRVEVTGLDALMILKGVMPREDKMFLLRKQAFLKNFVPGDSSKETLLNYRILKRECSHLPVIFLVRDLDGPASATASVIANVKSVPDEMPDYGTLFRKLEEALP